MKDTPSTSENIVRQVQVCDIRLIPNHLFSIFIGFRVTIAEGFVRFFFT
jgi:hypothetical protein